MTVIEKNHIKNVIAIFYLRKSKKIETGLTFETQHKVCYNAAMDILGENIDSIRIFKEDDVSGGNNKRKEYCKMKEFIKSNKCVLFAYSVDRLVRDVEEGLQLRKLLLENKCNLYIPKIGRIALETPEGKEQFISLCNSAETVLNIGKRNQAENLHQKAGMGIKSGSQAPYGYISYSEEVLINNEVKISTLYKVDEVEIYNVKKIYELYYKYRSISRVAHILEEEGVKGKYSEVINKSTVASVLRNPVNVKTDENVVKFFKDKGFKIINVQYGKGGTRYGQKCNAEFLDDIYREQYFFTLEHDGVIDSKKWLEIQEILDGNSRNPGKKGKSAKSALGNTIKCKCGADMKISTMKKDKNGNDIIYYSCTNQCGNKSMNGTNLENNIFSGVINISSKTLVRYMRKSIDGVLKEKICEYGILKSEIANLYKSNDKLTKKIEILEENKKARTTVLNEKVNKNKEIILNKEIRLVKIEDVIVNIKTEIIEYISKFEKYNCQQIIEELNFDGKKIIWNSVFDEVIWDSDYKNVLIKTK